MSQLKCVSLAVPAGTTKGDVIEFERVFSELLDSAAVSFYRRGSGDWVIEALFHQQPDMSAVKALLAPLYEKKLITPLPLRIHDVPDCD